MKPSGLHKQKKTASLSTKTLLLPGSFAPFSSAFNLASLRTSVFARVLLYQPTFVLRSFVSSKHGYCCFGKILSFSCAFLRPLFRIPKPSIPSFLRLLFCKTNPISPTRGRHKPLFIKELQKQPRHEPTKNQPSSNSIYPSDLAAFLYLVASTLFEKTNPIFTRATRL